MSFTVQSQTEQDIESMLSQQFKDLYQMVEMIRDDHLIGLWKVTNNNNDEFLAKIYENSEKGETYLFRDVLSLKEIQSKSVLELRESFIHDRVLIFSSISNQTLDNFL